MSIGRESKLERSDGIDLQKLVAAMELCAPSITKLQIKDKDALADFKSFKTIVMRFHHPLTADVLFSPLQKRETVHLLYLSTFDPDLFLHVVRYADRQAVDMILTDIGLTYLAHRYENNRSLVLRPLFEKASQKAIDYAVVPNESAPYRIPFNEILIYGEQQDVVALLKRIKPDSFRKIFALNPTLIDALIEANKISYVDKILPHLPSEDVIIYLSKDDICKPMDLALIDKRSPDNADVLLNAIPAGSKDHCCNEAAIRMIELLPRLPPIDTLFTAGRFFLSGVFTNSHPISYAVFNNPKLLNTLLLRAGDEEILKLREVLREVYPYLKRNVAMRIYSLMPDFTHEKESKQSKPSTSLSKYSRIIRPLHTYFGSKGNQSHIKTTRKQFVDVFSMLPQEIDCNLRSLIVAYTAKDQAESNAIESELKAIYFHRLDKLKMAYNTVSHVLEPHDAKHSAILDPALLILEYATSDQHLFYIFAKEVEKERKAQQSWLPSFTFLNGKSKEKSLDHEFKNAVAKNSKFVA